MYLKNKNLNILKKKGECERKRNMKKSSATRINELG